MLIKCIMFNRCHNEKHVSNCDVLCDRKLGVALYDEPYGAGTGAILLDDVSCRGNETSLTQCQHRTWGEHNCNHNEDVSIKCVDELSITGTAWMWMALPTSSFTPLRHQSSFSVL